MTARETPLLREAMRLREEGDLGQAVATLHGAVNPAKPEEGLLYLRLLFEFQSYAELQLATKFAIRNLRPDELSWEDAEYMSDLIRFANETCLPVRFIELAINKARPLSRESGQVKKAIAGATQRLRYRTKMEASTLGRVSIVSLGLNCLPWHLPARWGLRRARDYASLFVPFSLAGHTIEGVIGALEDDFVNYCTPETVRTVKSQRGHEFAIRKDRGAFWNHNRGIYWLKDDMAALRANVKQKAENFRVACQRPDVVFFLGTCPTRYPAEPLDFLPRLQAALARFTGTEHNRLLISNQTAFGAQPAFQRVDDTTVFVTCPYPSKEYVWHDDEAADARDGLIFERTFMSFLLRALVNWGLMRRRAGEVGADGLPDAA